MTTLYTLVDIDRIEASSPESLSSGNGFLPHNTVRTVLVADESLNFREIQVTGNNPTGEQILIASVGSVFPDSVLLQLLPTGEIEDIRHQERPSLESSNKFLTARSDRTYYFTLDGVKLERPYRCISGYAIRTLGRVGAEREVILDRDPGPQEVLDDKDLVGTPIYLELKLSLRSCVVGS